MRGEIKINSKFVNDISVAETVDIADNGIKIYGMKSHGLHSFCLSVYARGGVMYETDCQNGISHFVEHIVFRNINALMNGKLYDTLDRLGLTFTAATYKEFMQFSITGESSRLDCVSEIISLLLEPLDIRLCEGEFEAEKNRIRAEIREYDEKASLDYAVKRRVWEGNTNGDMITGTLGSVSKITLNKCEAERKRIFSSDNFFIYITGNYDKLQIKKLKSCVGKYELAPGADRTNIAPMPAGWGNRRLDVITKSSDYYMVELCFDMDTEAFSKAERSLFYDMMFAGENCRFFRELSENLGYIYSYDAKIEEYKNIGNLSISYEVGLKNLYDSIRTAVKLFNEMKQNAIGLDRAKVYYTDNACLALDNAEELNWNMAYENYILDEKIKSIADRAKKYSAVSDENIKSLARAVFDTKNLVVGIKGKKKNIDTDRIIEELKLLNMPI